jgi:hypothetical protein
MAAHAHHANLELRLRSLDQLFNSMDPSPFLEKDLDPDAEQFIREWALEPHHRDRDLRIHLHLEQEPGEGDARTLASEAIQHFFAYQARIERGVFRTLMRDGQVSLAIGVLFITACLTAASLIPGQESNHFLRALSESLLVAGWVGMWRPIEIFLYDWWPVRRRIRVFDRLAHATIDVRSRPRPRHAN